jgi:hypothetical protein
MMDILPPSSRALIVQSDGSLLLDVHDPGFEQARSDLSMFAELEKSPSISILTVFPPFPSGTRLRQDSMLRGSLQFFTPIPAILSRPTFVK